MSKMFSISCNLNSPNCDCDWHDRVYGNNSLHFNCMDCGMNLKLNQTTNKNIYSKILWDEYCIKQFVYACYMCGAMYSGFIVAEIKLRVYSESRYYNYKRIYFDFNEVENDIHIRLIYDYNRPVLTTNGSGELSVVTTNINDRFKNPTGTLTTPEKVIFKNMEMGK